MNPDLLDDLLDRSAPATRAAEDRGLRLMIAQARRGDALPRRRSRLVLGVGLATLLVGGGVAVATTIPQPWGDETSPYAHPDYAHAFALPSGRDCEMRIVVVAERESLSGSEQAMRDWLRGTDVWSLLDLSEAARRDAEHAARTPNQTARLDTEGRLGDVPEPPATRTPDDVRATLIDDAMDAAVDAAAEMLGIAPGAISVFTNVRCEAAR